MLLDLIHKERGWYNCACAILSLFVSQCFTLLYLGWNRNLWMWEITNSKREQDMCQRLSIITPPCIFEEAVVALLAHGCVVEMLEDKIRVIFPEGTTREEIPLHVHDRRYKIVLPDGWMLMEQDVGLLGKSVLYYAKE